MKQNWTFPLLVVAASAGWTLATAFDDVSRPYLAAVCAGTVLVGAGFRMVDASRVRWMAGGETVAVIAVPVGAFAAGSLAGSLDESSLLAGLFAALIIWVLAAITITDIEAVTEPTDLVEGISGALGRITTRFILVGIALMTAVVVGHGGLSPVTTARPTQSAVVAPFLVYWLVGFTGLASLNRSRLLARWKRDRSRIDADLEPRWRTATLLVLATATILALIWSFLGRPLLDLGHAMTAAGLRGAGGLISRLLGLELPAAGTTGGSGPTPVAPPQAAVNPITPPPEWFDLFLLIAAGAVFAFAFVVFRRRVKARGPAGSSLVWSVLGAIVAALWGVIRDLGLLLRSLFRRHGGVDLAGDRRHSRGRHDPAGWSPSDPLRRRIATEYRAFLTLARPRFGPIHGAETPSELARRIEGAEGQSAVGVLTEIYELARFSEDLLDQAMVRRAQEAHNEIAAYWEENG